MKWKYWLPVLVMMIFIFGFSSLPEQKVAQLSDPGIKQLNYLVYQVDPVAPKIEWLDFGHAIGYLFLASAFLYALTHTMALRHPFWFAWFFSFCYSLTDEFHQSFVPGQSSEWKDILIDTLAAGVALVFIAIMLRHRARKAEINRRS